MVLIYRTRHAFHSLQMGKIMFKNGIRYFSNINFKYLLSSEINSKILLLKLNRPQKRNSFNSEFFQEIKAFFASKDAIKYNAVIVCGNGQLFSSGIDTNEFINFFGKLKNHEEYHDKTAYVFDYIRNLQSFSKPIISVIHGACIGAAMAFVSCCDIRYCTPNTKFQLKEIEFGFPSDLGVLQSLPHLFNSASFANEMALTGRVFSGLEAEKFGFCQIIPSLLPDASNESINKNNSEDSEKQAYDLTLKHCIELANSMAKLHPDAISGTKENIRLARQGQCNNNFALNYAARYNVHAVQDPIIQRILLEKLKR